MPNRRRLLQMLGAVTAAGAGGWALLSGGRANAYYSGPASDHFDGVRFFNPNGVRPKGPGAFLKWQFGERGEAWPKSFPSPFPADRPPARFDGEGLRVTYVGHAAFLIQTRGKSVLVDPVWSERVSPVSFAGPKRVNAPGIAFDHLPAIDAVLVTHNHYDHMDTDTIARLWQRFRPRIVTPLGNDAILARKRAGPDGHHRRLGRHGRSGGRPRGARGADAALVGARHGRPHARAVGELRRARRCAQGLLRRRQRLRRRRHLRPASASATRASRWRYCQSAPTSRAGSCATST